MKILRTPEERFTDLPDYPFAPHYLEVRDEEMGSIRQHYVDEGDRGGPLVLLLHGEPTWSYLYRKMIPPLAKAGFRVIAPDLIGFGKSDKPADRTAYSYQRHVEWILAFARKLDLQNVHLFCQDWGGLLGLRLLAAEPFRFASVTASNTVLPTGRGKISDAFMRWRKYSQEVAEMPVGDIIRGGTVAGIADSVKAAYDAPFPDESFKQAARAFPILVPISETDTSAIDNQAAWKVLEAFEAPFLTLFGDQDPITAGSEVAMQRKIPGAQGQAHEIIENAGHFIQEDAGERLADKLIAFVNANT